VKIVLIALAILAVWALLVAVSTPSGRRYLAKLDREKRL
jgi:hypothetical protein